MRTRIVDGGNEEGTCGVGIGYRDHVIHFRKLLQLSQ